MTGLGAQSLRKTLPNRGSIADHFEVSIPALDSNPIERRRQIAHNGLSPNRHRALRRGQALEQHHPAPEGLQRPIENRCRPERAQGHGQEQEAAILREREGRSPDQC